MRESTVNFVKLHEHPYLINQCCDLLNLEWPRSNSSRTVIYPLPQVKHWNTIAVELNCFVLRCQLVSEYKETANKLAILQNKTFSGHYTEEGMNVLIHPEYRKRGLGRLLMEKSEEYAKSVGVHTLYLSTDDQQGFYATLGYSDCEPFSIYGIGTIPRSCTNSDSVNNYVQGGGCEPTQHPELSSPSIPPPPPLPIHKQPQSYGARTRKTYMKKIL